MGTTDDKIDKFITTVHGKNYGRALAQMISVPVGGIMHLKVLHFELDERNKCDALPDAEILEAIYIAQLIVMRSSRNQEACYTEGLKNTSMTELTVQIFTTSKFESFMENFKTAVSRVCWIHGVPIY